MVCEAGFRQLWHLQSPGSMASAEWGQLGSYSPDPESRVGGACSRAGAPAFLHHSVTGARGSDVRGFKEATRQMLGGCLTLGRRLSSRC